jgi:hypothetical protein
MNAKPTLSLAASGYTGAYRTQRLGALSISIEVDDATDAVGIFYGVSRAHRDAEWKRHPDLVAQKTAGNGLEARFDWPGYSGYEVAVEYEKTSGGTGQAATVHFNAE